jgi:hypothetical protein
MRPYPQSDGIQGQKMEQIKEPWNIFTSAERAINSLLEYASLMK